MLPLLVQTGSLPQLREFVSGGYLYALTDGGCAPEFAAQLQHLPTDRAVPLLCDGDAQFDPTAIVRLALVDGSMLQLIVQSLWRDRWGVSVFSKTSLDALRLHFRRFLVVQLPDGEQWFFRVYDPRILPIYLPNCNEWELRKFFGPVRAFGIPVLENGTLTFVQGPQSPATGAADHDRPAGLADLANSCRTGPRSRSAFSRRPGTHCQVTTVIASKSK